MIIYNNSALARSVRKAVRIRVARMMTASEISNTKKSRENDKSTLSGAGKTNAISFGHWQ